jgi:hypothetical protein
MRTRYVMGLDFGGAGEPTGFAVMEEPAVEESQTGEPLTEPEYHFRHVQRFPPGTSYHQIIDDVLDAADQPPLQKSPVVVDLTAVGRGVLDRLRRGKVPVVPTWVTAGHAVQKVEHGGWQVPKKELVTAVQMALQTRRLKIAPEMSDADLLVRELGGFRLSRVSTSDVDAEWRVGRHDDLVFAVALTCWYADRHPNRRLRIILGPRVIFPRGRVGWQA